MPSEIVATGLAGASFGDVLSHGFVSSKPTALGVAVAYVSISGFRYLDALVNKHRVQKFKLVADTRDGITHPMALAAAMKEGWDVRIVDDLPGTFHPKLYIGGSGFDSSCGIKAPTFVLAGSANLSSAALSRNGECSYINVGNNLEPSANAAWKECWTAGKSLTTERLAAYEKYFESRNRYRHPDDLVVLGVADEVVPPKNGRPSKGTPPLYKVQKVISNTSATVAWTGLQSFTGDYNFQVEFPRDAGEVLSRILTTVSKGNTANLICEDGEIRQFIFRYYDHNGMFRLNVPNSAPSAMWARQHKKGIAVVELNDDEDAAHFRIIRSGRELFGVIGRSFALGTWGRTPTRLYGWY